MLMKRVSPVNRASLGSYKQSSQNVHSIKQIQMLFGVTVRLYFRRILIGSRNLYLPLDVIE